MPCSALQPLSNPSRPRLCGALAFREQKSIEAIYNYTFYRALHPAGFVFPQGVPMPFVCLLIE